MTYDFSETFGIEGTSPCGPDLPSQLVRTMENFHLMKLGDSWHLTEEGAVCAWKTFPTKEIAMSGSAEFLEGKTASLKIHGEDGTLLEKRIYTYSADLSQKAG